MFGGNCPKSQKRNGWAHTHTTPALEGEMSIFDLCHFAGKTEEGPSVVMRWAVVLFKTCIHGGRKAKPVVAISFPVLSPKALIRILTGFSYLTKYLHKDSKRLRKRTFSSYIFRFCPQLTKITNRRRFFRLSLRTPSERRPVTFLFLKKQFVECSYCTTSSSAAQLLCRRYRFGQITHLRAKKKLFSLRPNEQMLSEVQSTS